jgi:hypothetical protein
MNVPRPLTLVPDLTYCPWLPYIASEFLHWMSEDQVFSCCAAMIDNHQTLISSRLETWKVLLAFSDLVTTYSPKSHALMMSVFPKEDYTGRWFRFPEYQLI